MNLNLYFCVVQILGMWYVGANERTVNHNRPSRIRPHAWLVAFLVLWTTCIVNVTVLIRAMVGVGLTGESVFGVVSFGIFAMIWLRYAAVDDEIRSQKSSPRGEAK